jgi:50S ribosomal protein L16 3-hydroxylase
VHPAADALLRRFDFVPYARLDDVMVSYAAPGGGVGPHVDSYDVFLLQGQGRRRWRLSAKGPHEFYANAPLRILRNFRPDEECLLQPGDMLYLPPGWAHEGTALDPCLTHSIGFRAPSQGEIAAGFLAWLEERIALEGVYADPDLRPARNAAEIPRAMVLATERAARAIRWKKRDLTLFVGIFLTAPKPRVAFVPPRPALDAQLFARRCGSLGVRLDPRSQLLFQARNFFINGEAIRPAKSLERWLKKLAHQRRLAPRRRLPRSLCTLLRGWYLSGWVQLGDTHGR